MKVLVTGITGKSGKWFLNRLTQEQSINNESKYMFRAVIRSPSKAGIIDENPIAIEKVYGDLDDVRFVKSIMNDVSVVLHIAGIHTSLNIVKAAIENDTVQRLILVHTTGIYSKYKSASREYLAIEEEIGCLLKEKDIELTILRPTMIYGSITDRNIAIFIKMIDKLRIFPVINHAHYLLQPVHEKDLGNAYFQVLVNKETTANKNYILSGEKPILLIDIFKIIGKYLGKATTFISIPFPFAYFGGWVVYIFTFGKIDFREKIQRLVENRVFDHKDASRDFGYSPISFEEGVRDEVLEYLNK